MTSAVRLADLTTERLQAFRTTIETDSNTLLAAAGDGPPAAPGPAGAAGVVAERAGPSLLAHRGLASLPEPQREAVLLACCGYTWRQAADLLGVPASTVAERLRDGLLGLGNCPY